MLASTPKVWSFPFSFHDKIYKCISLLSRTCLVPPIYLIQFDQQYKLWSHALWRETGTVGSIQRHAGGLGVRTPCGRRFSLCHIRPEWPWGPPRVLYNEHWSPFLGEKRPGGGVCGGAYHSPPSKAEVQSGYSYNSTTPLCFPGVLEDDLYLYSLYSFSRHPATWPNLGSNIHLRNVTTRRKSMHFSLRRPIWFLQCFFWNKYRLPILLLYTLSAAA